jgi:phage terminase small subunit
MASMNLTPQQELFAQRIAGGEAQADAYRAAYPASRENKPVSVSQMACRLAANPKVAARIRDLRDKSASRLMITQERVLREAARIAFFDPRRVFDETGRLLPIHELDDDTAAAIARVELDDAGAPKKIHACNKTESLEKLFKFLGLYEKDNRQKTDPLRELIESLSGKVVGVTDR